MKALTILSCVVITVCSCSSVQPWDKAILAKPQMALDDNPVTAGLEDHTYFSKESSSGGRGFGGGGCGCN